MKLYAQLAPNRIGDGVGVAVHGFLALRLNHHAADFGSPFFFRQAFPDPHVRRLTVANQCAAFLVARPLFSCLYRKYATR